MSPNWYMYVNLLKLQERLCLFYRLIDGMLYARWGNSRAFQFVFKEKPLILSKSTPSFLMVSIRSGAEVFGHTNEAQQRRCQS